MATAHVRQASTSGPTSRDCFQAIAVSGDCRAGPSQSGRFALRAEACGERIPRFEIRPNRHTYQLASARCIKPAMVTIKTRSASAIRA